MNAMARIDVRHLPRLQMDVARKVCSSIDVSASGFLRGPALSRENGGEGEQSSKSHGVGGDRKVRMSIGDRLRLR